MPLTRWEVRWGPLSQVALETRDVAPGARRENSFERVSFPGFVRVRL